MKNTVLENINDIIRVKNELKGILIAVGMNPSNDFETYAQLFRDALDMINNQSNIILGE